MFDELKTKFERARARAWIRRQKKFVARVLEVKHRQVYAVFRTNGGEGLAAYYSRERGKMWMQFVGFDGSVYGGPTFIGNSRDALEHMAATSRASGWVWHW